MKPEREILFRAKRLDNGEWVESPCIDQVIFGLRLKKDAEWIECDPSTLSQYTGLRDKDGERIWEGSIAGVDGWVGEIVFSDCAFVLDANHLDGPLLITLNELPPKVIGDIHTTPELLETQE